MCCRNTPEIIPRANSCAGINNCNIIYLFTAIGLLLGGSDYFTCKQNMKLVTTRFKSEGYMRSM